jgi:hypothetical protein
MRKVALLVMLALVVPAMADLQQGKLVGPGPIARGTVVYDDTVNSTNYAYQAGVGSALGDEVFPDFTNAPGNILEDLAFSVGSFDDPGLQSCDLSVDIFNYNPDTGMFDLAGNITLPGQTFDLQPAYFATVSLTDLSPLNIALSDDVLITVTATNANVGNVGQLIYDPPVWGASGDYFYQDGAWYWFGGAPVANFYYYLGTVPEPGSLALLALGALTLVRRR